jgi:methylated-DNA-protein-cysteine methyltransferase-like protein
VTQRATISFYERVYAVVRQVPAGKVVTYGQVAALLGSPRAARAVGYALRFLPCGSTVPWHRVINHRGQISLRFPAESPRRQRLLLAAEGVVFDAAECVDLAVYRWHGEPEVES